MKIVSWNINGIRAIVKKGFVDFLSEHQPDILGLQEVKIDDGKRFEEQFDFKKHRDSLYEQKFNIVTEKTFEKNISNLVTEIRKYTKHFKELGKVSSRAKKVLSKSKINIKTLKLLNKNFSLSYKIIKIIPKIRIGLTYNICIIYGKIYL